MTRVFNRLLDRLLDWVAKPQKARPLPPVTPIEGPTGPRPFY